MEARANGTLEFVCFREADYQYSTFLEPPVQIKKFIKWHQMRNYRTRYDVLLSNLDTEQVDAEIPPQSECKIIKRIPGEKNIEQEITK